MATVRNRYVDTDVVGGSANGTSWANAYSSLNTAEQAEDDSGNIVGSDEYVVFHCRGVTAADTAAVTVNGWTTDATRYIQIQCDSGDGHGGVWTTSKYRLSVTDTAALTIGEDYVRTDGVQIESVVPTAIGKHCLTVTGQTATTNDIWLSNSLLRGHGHGTHTQSGVNIADSDCIFSAWNCIVYGIGAITGSRAFVLGGAVHNVYSCTAIGGQYAYLCYLTTTLKNCYGGGSSSEDFARVSGTLAKTNCASDDASADDTGTGETASNCVINATYSTSSGAYFTNVTAGSEDLRIASASSALVNAGTDTSGESAPLNFTTDIAGQTRA